MQIQDQLFIKFLEKYRENTGGENFNEWTPPILKGGVFFPKPKEIISQSPVSNVDENKVQEVEERRMPVIDVVSNEVQIEKKEVVFQDLKNIEDTDNNHVFEGSEEEEKMQEEESSNNGTDDEEEEESSDNGTDDDVELVDAQGKPLKNFKTPPVAIDPIDKCGVELTTGHWDMFIEKLKRFAPQEGVKKCYFADTDFYTDFVLYSLQTQPKKKKTKQEKEEERKGFTNEQWEKKLKEEKYKYKPEDYDLTTWKDKVKNLDMRYFPRRLSKEGYDLAMETGGKFQASEAKVPAVLNDAENAGLNVAENAEDGFALVAKIPKNETEEEKEKRYKETSEFLVADLKKEAEKIKSQPLPEALKNVGKEYENLSIEEVIEKEKKDFDNFLKWEEKKLEEMKLENSKLKSRGIVQRVMNPARKIVKDVFKFEVKEDEKGKFVDFSVETEMIAERVVIPILNKGHFVLVVYENKGDGAYCWMWDSKPDHSGPDWTSKTLLNVGEWMEILRFGKVIGVTQIPEVRFFPVQLKGSNDCGVYMCVGALLNVLGMDFNMDAGDLEGIEETYNVQDVVDEKDVREENKLQDWRWFVSEVIKEKDPEKLQKLLDPEGKNKALVLEDKHVAPVLEQKHDVPKSINILQTRRITGSNTNKNANANSAPVTVPEPKTNENANANSASSSSVSNKRAREPKAKPKNKSANFVSNTSSSSSLESSFQIILGAFFEKNENDVNSEKGVRKNMSTLIDLLDSTFKDRQLVIKLLEKWISDEKSNPFSDKVFHSEIVLRKLVDHFRGVTIDPAVMYEIKDNKMSFKNT